MPIVKYHKALDGELFEDAEKCKDHDDKILLKRLEGMTAADIERAICGKNKLLRDSMIQAYNLIQVNRRANGEVKARATKEQ